MKADRQDDDGKAAASVRPSLLSGVAAPAIVRQVGFAHTLSIGHRRQLRHIIRKTHAQYFRDVPTDVECDKLIDSFGPRVAAKMVMDAQSRGKV